ncbi:MAG: MmgE/PrpD family protein, partial [Betaproteobacteria bacterium]|nr:MmgE/PrpD family protein [Betaproteobacteria bacterium]
MSPNDFAGSLTSTVATYIDQVTYKDVPRRVIEPIEDSVIDAIGCGVIGSTSREVKILTGYFAEMKSAEESVIWGTSIKACAPLAAAANAAAVHAWDFDDTVLPGIVHPAGIVVSTGLSIAEKKKERINGKEFLTALAAGYEVANLMSAALGGRKWRVNGFYNTVPVIFGSAAVAGKLLGLGKGKLAGALGIAATQAAGLYSATMTKRFNAPKAVEGGIFAAELARRGFEAPVDAIGDEQGFLRTFSRDPQWDVIPREIGKYAFEVYHKYYPC